MFKGKRGRGEGGEWWEPQWGELWTLLIPGKGSTHCGEGRDAFFKHFGHKTMCMCYQEKHVEQWRKVKLLTLLIPGKGSTHCGANGTMHPHRQVVWGFTWKCTVDKSQIIDTIDPGESFNALFYHHDRQRQTNIITTSEIGFGSSILMNAITNSN